MNEQTNTTESNTVKPCRKCGAMDRNADGRCKSCRRAIDRKWREANKEKVAYNNRKHREANRDKVSELNRKWREANPEKNSERNRKWREANPEKRKVLNHNRRARIKGNGGTLSKAIVQTLMTLQKGKCACCGKSLKHGHHLDHVIPIALGGTNTDDNVQLLTPACNLSKGSKHPVDYMRSKGKLI